MLPPYACVTDNVSVSSSHSLLVKDETGLGVFTYLVPQITESTNVPLYVSFDINLGQNSVASQVGFLDQVLNPLVLINFDNLGHIDAETPGGNVVLASYVPNTWYHM